MTLTPTSSIDASALQLAITAALTTVRRNSAAFGVSYPDDTTTQGRYLLRPSADGAVLGGNRGWTTSFFTGMQWLAWELSGDQALCDAALAHAHDYADRVEKRFDLDTHDLGFLSTLSTVPAARLLRDERAIQASVASARYLLERLLEPAGIIQAWGDLDDPHQRGRTIIDSLMNMPLLMWAAEHTSDPQFARAVSTHTAQLRNNIFRENNSTFHTFHWDPETGEALGGSTEQGASDDSCWARGQAWGIYGFALNHRETGDPASLDAAWRCADYFLEHLPADSVPYWDLVYTDGSTAPRDSSAAAIAVCGLMELAQLPDDRAIRAAAAAQRILRSLIENYTPSNPEDSDALLLHGVYDLPKNVGVDEGNLWGDYFYLEALMRASNPTWIPYW